MPQIDIPNRLKIFTL